MGRRRLLVALAVGARPRGDDRPGRSRSRRPTGTSSGTSACRGWCWPGSSGRCCRSPARATRACSATRSSTRTCSASPPAPASGRRWCSPGVGRRAAAGRWTRSRSLRSSWRSSPSPSPTSSARRSARCAAASRWCSPGWRCRRWRRRSRRSCCSATPTSIREVYTWILGRFTGRRGPTCGSCCRTSSSRIVVLSLHRRHLDVLRVGDDEAASLGTDVRRLRLVVVIAATLGTAAVGQRQRADRLRRHHRAARHPAGRRGVVPPAAAAQRAVRRGVPDPRRHPRPRRCRRRRRRRSASSRRSSARRSSSLLLRKQSGRVGVSAAAIELRCGVRDWTPMSRHELLDFAKHGALRWRGRSSHRHVAPGEWLCLIGPNGAGKSSILRAAAGLVDHDGDDRRRRRRRWRCARARRRADAGRLRAAGAGAAGRHDRLRVRPARPQPVHRLLRAGEPRHDRRWSPACCDRLELDEFADRQLGDAERWRAPAAGDRPRAGPGGADPAARRTDQRARHRPPAAGARAGRRGCAASTA